MEELFTNIKEGFLIIINGKQRSGKSQLISYIMYCNRKNFQYGISFSGTSFDPENLSYIPEKYKYMQYNETKLHNLMKIQQSFPKEERPLAFVIFDDCINDKKQWNSKILLDLLTQLYHYNIVCIISTQYINKIPALLRENARLICIFKTDTLRSLEAAYESYGQNYDTFKEFKNFLLESTGDYKFIVRDNKDASNFQIMRAPKKIPSFTLNY